MNLFAIPNGMTLDRGSTVGTISLQFGFSYIPQDGSADVAFDQVTVSIGTGASQTQVRAAVRTALRTWATARGDTITQFLLDDLTIVVP